VSTIPSVTTEERVPAFASVVPQGPRVRELNHPPLCPVFVWECRMSSMVHAWRERARAPPRTPRQVCDARRQRTGGNVVVECDTN
jgi:hypothetical protein